MSLAYRRLAPDEVDWLERLSRLGTLVTLVIAVAASILAPLLALSWSNRPFPGVLVEPTLMATSVGSAEWSARAAGLAPPQRVMRLGGQAVGTTEEYQAVVSSLAVGEGVPIFAQLPDGTPRLYPNVKVGTFGDDALWRLFVVPYLIGVAYLVIGIWVYGLRGMTRPGRVLAFFCFCAATTCILVFDVWTTHAATRLWSAAVALSGGAILSLAMRFPEEGRAVRHHPWLLAVPYAVAMVLAAWSTITVQNMGQPYAYIDAWSASYRYVAVAILAFLALTLRRAYAAESSVSRRQARIVLVGGGLAFLPVTVWFMAPLVGRSIPFEPFVFLAPLLLFPLSIWIAIVRYRLLDVDDLVSRTVLYGALTAILAGIYTISITISQKLFVGITGEKSDAAVVFTTLIVVSVFTPLRARLQALLDRRLKNVGERGAELRRFADQVRLVAQVSRPERVARRFVDEAVAGLRAESGALSLPVDGQWRLAHTAGPWRGEVWLSAALASHGQRLGVIWLGRPIGRRRYTDQERDALGAVAQDLADTLWLASAPAPEVAPWAPPSATIRETV